MAPEWTRAVRPLVLVWTAIAFAVTLVFRADVVAQSGAYATGVLVLISSAAVAVTLSARHHHQRPATIAFGVITLLFIYTTVANILERPDGVKIASFFIAAILTTSLISRVTRSTELRVTEIQMDQTARRFIQEAASGEIRIIANEPNERDQREYLEKEREERAHHHIPASRAPAKSGFVPVCPLTTAWPSAMRPRWPSRMPDSRYRHVRAFCADRDFAGALAQEMTRLKALKNRTKTQKASPRAIRLTRLANEERPNPANAPPRKQTRARK
jgi:hypothetical protein